MSGDVCFAARYARHDLNAFVQYPGADFAMPATHNLLCGIQSRAILLWGRSNCKHRV
jgi:hypothetical protein